MEELGSETRRSNPCGVHPPGVPRQDTKEQFPFRRRWIETVWNPSRICGKPCVTRVQPLRIPCATRAQPLRGPPVSPKLLTHLRSFLLPTKNSNIFIKKKWFSFIFFHRNSYNILLNLLLLQDRKIFHFQFSQLSNQLHVFAHNFWTVGPFDLKSSLKPSQINFGSIHVSYVYILPFSQEELDSKRTDRQTDTHLIPLIYI